MPRITPIDPSTAVGSAKTLLDGVHAALGVTPNLMKTLAVAPAALEGYLALNTALAHGVLDTASREAIALAVAQVNACEYCLSAHAYLGSKAGLSGDEMARNRASHSRDARRDAGLQFAQAVVVSRGQVSDATLAAARQRGLSDAELLEIVVNVSLNVLTNYVNHVAGTTVDFPRVDVEVPASA